MKRNKKHKTPTANCGDIRGGSAYFIFCALVPASDSFRSAHAPLKLDRGGLKKHMKKTPLDIFKDLKSFEALYNDLSELEEDLVDTDEFLKDVPTVDEFWRDLNDNKRAV